MKNNSSLQKSVLTFGCQNSHAAHDPAQIDGTPLPPFASDHLSGARGENRARNHSSYIAHGIFPEIVRDWVLQGEIIAAGLLEIGAR